MLSACLIPPPLEPVPRPDNRPPRIVPDRLAPGPTVEPQVLPDACPEVQEFQASLEDPDGDTLYWRVFVDYFAGGDREPQPQEVQVEPDLAARIAFTVPRTSGYRSINPHAIELYVADRPFAVGPIDNQGRQLDDPDGLTDTFVWTVTLDPARNGDCPPP